MAAAAVETVQAMAVAVAAAEAAKAAVAKAALVAPKQRKANTAIYKTTGLANEYGWNRHI